VIFYIPYSYLDYRRYLRLTGVYDTMKYPY
jgi:hypothetical protein